MAKINGMEMPEPSSGGGGSIVNGLMGIFRERTKAQKQLEMMAYGSALNVAGHVVKTKLGAEALSEADIEHAKRIYNPETWGNEAWAKKAAKVRQAQYKSAGLKELSGSKIAYQARGTVVSEGRDGQRAKTSSADVKKRTVGTEDTTVNGQAQTVGEANVGDRTPAPTKGGYIRPSKRGSKATGQVTPAGNIISTGGGMTEITPSNVATGKAPSSYGGEGTTTPIINPASPVAGVNQPKSNAPRAKRVSKKPGRGQMPPAGGTNA